MNRQDEQKKTEAVRTWWETNPFTFGLAKNGDLVGHIPTDQMDRHYFDEIERKFRKHHRHGAQEDGARLFSNLIDYETDVVGKKVLDIAVGSGFSVVAFKEAGADVVAIDLTDYAVEETKRNLEVHGLSARVLQMDAQHLAFEDHSFDFVNAWGCFMHMPNTLQAIREACRVLKPGGKCFAYMYNKNSWPFWFNILFLRGILLLGLLRYKGSVERLTARYSDGATLGGNIKTTFYTPKAARTLFQEAGFSDVKAFPLHLPHEPNHWPMRTFPFFKFLSDSIKQWMAHRFGYGLIVVAVK